MIVKMRGMIAIAMTDVVTHPLGDVFSSTTSTVGPRGEELFIYIMAEPFSRRVPLINMADMEDEDTVLDILHEILETERTFYGTVRFLDGQTRNHIVAAQLRNTSVALQILRSFMDRPAQPQSLVMNIDLSGNILRNFLDPVPVVATPAQLAAGTETNVVMEHETCSICREAVTVGTRLRHCGHCFHSDCINEWLGVNTRCPVCRHDIREPGRRRVYSNNPDDHQ
jgi:predicted Zn-ribbon and HTH transcriptional regulator